MSNVVREKIGEGIELLIEGLPTSQLTAATQAQTALALVKHILPAAASFSAGIVGDGCQVWLSIDGQLYRLKLAIKMQRALTLIELSSQTMQWIEFQASRGVFDREMAGEMIATLRKLGRKAQAQLLAG